MTPSLYTQREIQDLWEGQRFRRDRLLTEDALRLVVEFPGWRSGEGGPDFQGARLRLGGVEVRGDMEIHLTPSGWRGGWRSGGGWRKWSLGRTRMVRG